MAELKVIIPPHSEETEMIVLGCMLTSLGSLNIAGELLDEKDFYIGVNRRIFGVLKKLYLEGKPADVHLVAEQCKRTNQLTEIGGVPHLTTLAQYAGTAAHIEEYVQGLKEKSLNRELLHMSAKIQIAASKDPENPYTLLERLLKEVQDLGKGHSPNDKVCVGEILSGKKSRVSTIPLIQRLQDRHEYYAMNKKPFMTGIPTGFADLDSQVTLLEPTNLVILAARPAMGKTALALNIASNICFEQGYPVAIISLEMGADQLAERLISLRTRIAGEDLKRGSFSKNQLQKMEEEFKTLMRGKFFIHDQNCSSISQLVSKARRLRDENDIELLIVDYLQLLGTDGSADSRQYEVAEVSRRLKTLAMDLQIPILCVAQLSRKVEERADKRPLLSDLKDSGQIEQDSDAVVFIYRGDYYAKGDREEKVEAEVYVGKNRHGPEPSILLEFDLACGRFQNPRKDERGICF